MQLTSAPSPLAENFGKSSVPDLFPYQVEGANFLAGSEVGFLADDPGLGKTAQAVKAVDKLKVDRFAVVAPASTRTNWVRTFDIFGSKPRRILKLVSQADAGLLVRPDGQHGPYDGVVVSFDLLTRAPVRQAIAAFAPQVLHIDEAHYLKNPDSGRTKAIYGIACDRNGGLADVADYVWPMSGTPLRTNVIDLFPHLHALAPKLIRGMTYWEFAERYCTWNETPYGVKWTGHTKLIDELREATKGFFLRRTAEEVLPQLPPALLSEFVLEAEDDPIARALREVEAGLDFDGLMAHVEIPDRAPPAHISELRRVQGVLKAKASVKLLSEELAEYPDDKIVVFAWHKEAIDVLHEGLAKFGVARLTGDTPAAWRQSAIDDFRTRADVRVFLGNIAAAGTGVDGLQYAAHRMFMVEMSWVPSDNAQAVRRLARLGQRLPVLCRFAILDGSLDEPLVRTLVRRTKDIGAFFGK